MLKSQTMSGQDIRRYRRQLGWSQEDLARRLEVSNRTVCSWENEETKPRGHIVIALRVVFANAGITF